MLTEYILINMKKQNSNTKDPNIGNDTPRVGSVPPPPSPKTKNK